MAFFSLLEANDIPPSSIFYAWVFWLTKQDDHPRKKREIPRTLFCVGNNSKAKIFEEDRSSKGPRYSSCSVKTVSSVFGRYFFQPNYELICDPKCAREEGGKRF